MSSFVFYMCVYMYTRAHVPIPLISYTYTARSDARTQSHTHIICLYASRVSRRLCSRYSFTTHGDFYLRIYEKGLNTRAGEALSIYKEKKGA